MRGALPPVDLRAVCLVRAIANGGDDVRRLMGAMRDDEIDRSGGGLELGRAIFWCVVWELKEGKRLEVGGGLLK